MPEKSLLAGRREVYPESEAIREVSPPVQSKSRPFGVGFFCFVGNTDFTFSKAN
jgi:hypothetical protein